MAPDTVDSGVRVPGASRGKSSASGIPKIVILDENQMYAHYMRRLNREWMRHIEVGFSIVDRDLVVINKTYKRRLAVCSGPITRRRRTAPPRSYLPFSLLHTRVVRGYNDLDVSNSAFCSFKSKELAGCM